MSPQILTHQKAFTLIEVLVVSIIAIIVLVAFTRFQSNLTRRNLEISARATAQSELDDFALQLRKDFERHAPLSTTPSGLQLTPSSAPFATGPTGRQNCQNLSVLQTIFSSATTNKIEYKTLCVPENGSYPTDYSPGNLHPQLTIQSCAHAPKVTRTYWPLSTLTAGATAGAIVTTYPSSRVNALSMCIRPNAATTPTQYGAELSVAYQSIDGSWRELKKSLTLITSEFGTSGIQILTPQ